MHVISIPEPPPIVRSRFPRRDLLLDTIREGAKKRLREISLSLNAGRIWLEIREGDPVRCLIEVAQAFSADLIIAGAHGERPGRALLGSVVDGVLRGATCPVLVVPERIGSRG